jgi:hypothetical protein
MRPDFEEKLKDRYFQFLSNIGVLTKQIESIELIKAVNNKDTNPKRGSIAEQDVIDLKLRQA